MKTAKLVLITLAATLHYFPTINAQTVTISGETIVGKPGDGSSLLSFNSERSWAFRQYGVGPSTALELFDRTGQKNFLISTTANVGIGILVPTAKLHVNGNIIAGGGKVSFGTIEYLEDGGSFMVACNGTFRSTADAVDDLGTSANRWKNVWASNGTISTSDLKLKSNVQSIPYGLKQIMMLQPVSFAWTDKPEYGNKLGLIAQDVQKVISEVVVDSEFVRNERTGKLMKVPVQQLGMYYSDLIPVLIKGMQEQQQIIIEKENRIAKLESYTEGIEIRLAKLEKLMKFTIPAPAQ